MTLRRCTQSYSSQTSFWQKKLNLVTIVQVLHCLQLQHDDLGEVVVRNRPADELALSIHQHSNKAKVFATEIIIVAHLLGLMSARQPTDDREGVQRGPPGTVRVIYTR
jgi:hypothetical protein